MTVYAINNLINKEQIESYKKYLGVKHFTVMYSDWANEFNIRIAKGHRCNEQKKQLVLKRIIQMNDLMNMPIKYIQMNGVQLT